MQVRNSCASKFCLRSKSLKMAHKQRVKFIYTNDRSQVASDVPDVLTYTQTDRQKYTNRQIIFGISSKSFLLFFIILYNFVVTVFAHQPLMFCGQHQHVMFTYSSCSPLKIAWFEFLNDKQEAVQRSRSIVREKWKSLYCLQRHILVCTTTTAAQGSCKVQTNQISSALS